MRIFVCFQLHLTENRVGAPSINATVAALRFFFTVTLDRPEVARHLTFVHEPRKLPVVLSPEEVARLLEAAPGVKYKAALSVAYGAGLRVSEVVGAEGVGHRQRAHAAARRAGQGRARIATRCSRRAAGTAARLVAHRAAAGLAVPGP